MVYTKVAERTYMIDTVGAGTPNSVAVYVVKGSRKTAVVDCGFSSTYGNVMQGLRQMGIEPSNVDYLIPTHAHLDHSGAVGHLLMHMPRAKVIAHERTAPHLVDPAKLIESATGLFGEKLIQLYGKPIPVDKGRVTAVGQESHIDLGGASLTTLYAPGHAAHQISVLFEEERALFTADAVGLAFPSFPTLVPTAPPPSFDLVKMVKTLEMLRQTDPKLLLLPHFGQRKDVGIILDRTKEATESWVKEVAKMNEMHQTPEQMAEQMRRKIAEDTGMRVADFPGFVNVMIRLTVLGIVGYLKWVASKPPESPL